jgi:O-antigen biosynthesis protein
MDNSLNPQPATSFTTLNKAEQPLSTTDNARTKVVIVVGMHRSGTSAITRGLKALDVQLGERLWPPNEAVNAKGFWEDMDINGLNVEMMTSLQSDWHYLSPIKQPQIEKLVEQGFLARAITLLRAKVGDSIRFGFKDPRIAKLLPFWQKVVDCCGYDVNYLLTTRHPLSVVESIRRRDGFDAEKCYLLWLVHVLEMLEATRGYPRVLVDFDRLMESPERELKRVAAAFSLTLDRSGMANYASDFLDESLRHTKFDSHDIASDNSCLPLIRDVYATLVSAAADALPLDSISFRERFDGWRSEFERLEPTLLLVDKLASKHEAATIAIIEKDRLINDLVAKVDSLSNEIASQAGMVNPLGDAIVECDPKPALAADAGGKQSANGDI